MPWKDYEKNKERARELTKKYNTEMRGWFNEIKSEYKCGECGESHPACIDFHHRDSTTKIMNVAGMVSSRKPRAVILEEIAKCDALCRNCHAKLHWAERNP